MSAWKGYTSTMMHDHINKGLPVWAATMARHSNLPEKRKAGKLVYCDISSPTQEGLVETIKCMIMSGFWVCPDSYRMEVPND